MSHLQHYKVYNLTVLTPPPSNHRSPPPSDDPLLRRIFLMHNPIHGISYLYTHIRIYIYIYISPPKRQNLIDDTYSILLTNFMLEANDFMSRSSYIRFHELARLHVINVK